MYRTRQHRCKKETRKQKKKHHSVISKQPVCSKTHKRAEENSRDPVIWWVWAQRTTAAIPNCFESKIKSKYVWWAQWRVESLLSSPCFLTLPFLFLSPPKNFPIWSRRPGFFFLRPSPNAACPEPLADAIFVLEFGLCVCVWKWVF